MKLTFIHDGPLFADSGGQYYEFAYHRLYERYSYLADEIVFLMRVKPVKEARVFTPVPPEIQVVSVPDFKSPKAFLTKREKARQIVRKAVAESDCFVLRTQSSIAQLALPMIRKANKPYIIECVGCSWDSYWHHGLMGKLVAPYMFGKTRKAVRNAPYVCYVTSAFLQRRYPTHGKTVSCSNVVLEEPDEAVLTARLKKLQSFDPRDRLIIGTAAALDTPYKGQEHVIRAIREMVRAGWNVEYHLAGGMNGYGENRLKRIAVEAGVTNRVVFEGSLSINQMPGFYDALDIYIQPSKQEGLPRAVIEAMSRGCPVIGTGIAGIPELIQPENLFRKGSDRAVFTALRQILQSDLSACAKENFQKAGEYTYEKLRKKREAFHDVFLENV